MNRNRRYSITYLTLNWVKSLHLRPVIQVLARMAELVDASDSKSGIGNDVQVRFLFRAPNPTYVGFFMRIIHYWQDFQSIRFCLFLLEVSTCVRSFKDVFIFYFVT
jgi:hypothetical protein